MRRRAKPSKAKVEAKAPAARKSLKNDGSKVRDLEKRLAEALEREAEALRHESEALERETATAEILKVISGSPTDLQPVFDAVAESAARLCNSLDAHIFLRDGDFLRPVGHHGSIPIRFTIPVVRGTANGRAVLDGRTVHIVDMQTEVDEFPEGSENARRMGHRTVLNVPLMREGVAIGTIGVRRTEARLFTERQVALLQTFADQAVIAIENVRLFNETKEALERQTATSEILQVIATSPTDVQPVLDALVESAGRLCEAADTFLLLVEGDQLRVAALHPSVEGGVISNPIQRGWVAGRAVMELRTVHVEDLANAQSEFPLGWEIAVRLGHRTALAMPLLRKGVPIGALFLRRREVRQFSDKEITLLKTFADQAVIAIENVRLFNETKETLEQQTATAEILRVISQSPTDVRPVFDAILASSTRLCEADYGILFLAETDGFRAVAFRNVQAEFAAVLAAFRQFGAKTGMGRLARDKQPVHIPDVLDDDAYREGEPTRLATINIGGVRTWLGVPLLQGDVLTGAIVIYRKEQRAFTNAQIALVQTFADQAVIAIENVRLFKELQEKNGALTEALEQQTATSDILQTIAQAQTDVQPVFETIVRSAAQLCHAHTTSVFLTDGQMLYLPANYGISPEAIAAIRARFPRPLDRGTVTGTAILNRSVMHVPDVEEPSAVEFARQTGRVGGFRSLLAVPMLRQGEAVGAVSVSRREPGPFSDAEVALLQTFADQAVIAIENVRLFNELDGANRELSAASQHKSEFLANMSHELRTPLNAIIGFSEVLSEKMFGDLNEKQEEYLKDIHASGQHLLSLINDILDLSKIEAGRMELEVTDFDLPTAIDNALMLVRERAGRRSITLQTSVDERLGQIQADERKVRQVVLNLLSNAIKFTPEGGRLEVSAMPRDGSVEVSVSDTGVGIAPEDQEAIFEAFRQVGTAAKKVEGTGLGLTLCRKFVELHGGKIWVKSELGVGSTFTFSLPLRSG
jgi:signal transduction histidine kinase